MDKVKFTREEKDQMIQKVRRYFHEKLDQELGGFDAEFLIDFFGEELGVYYYNRGVYDAEALLSGKIEELSDCLLQLEKAVGD